MSTYSSISSQRWEAVKPTILDFYVNKNQTLKQVMEEMQRRGFEASKPQYVRQLKKCNITKNRTGNEWKYISNLLTRRSRRGKMSLVFMDGQQVPAPKVRKRTQEYEIPGWLSPGPTPEPMDCIEIRTPHALVHGVNSPLAPTFARQEGQTRALQTRGRSPHVVPIVLDNLPSVAFMDLLDEKVSKYRQTFITSTSSVIRFSQDFFNDILFVKTCCEKSLRLVGYTYPLNDNALEGRSISRPLLTHLGVSPTNIQKALDKDELDELVHLIKVIVYLSSNSTLENIKDSVFDVLVDVLNVINPLERLLELVSSYNLYWLLEELLSIHTLVARIFAGDLLPLATDQEDTKLVQLLLQSKPPLDSKVRREVFSAEDQVTALEIAILRQNSGLVRLLLDAGADPYGYTWHRIWNWSKHSIHDRKESCLILRYVLDARVAACHSKHHKDSWKCDSWWVSRWQYLIEDALISRVSDYYGFVLRKLIELIKFELQTLALMLVNGVLKGNELSVKSVLLELSKSRTLLEHDSMFQLTFQAILVHAVSSQQKALTNQLVASEASICMDFATAIDWVIHSGLNSDDAELLSILLDSGDPLKKSSLGRLWAKILLNGWLNLAELLTTRKLDLHEHCWKREGQSFDKCLLHFYLRDGQHLQNDGMLDFLLSQELMNSGDKALCFLISVVQNGDLSFFKRILKAFSNKSIGFNFKSTDELLTTPELLMSIMATARKEIMEWAIASKPCFDALNQALSNGLVDTPDYLFPQFSHSPSILQEALASGILPSQGLLSMCVLSCCRYNVKNMRMVIEARRAKGQPFSPEDLTLCAKDVVYQIWKIGNDFVNDMSCRCQCDCIANYSLMMKLWCFRPLKLLAEHGAEFEDPGLSYALQSNDDYFEEVVLRMIRFSDTLFHSAVFSGNIPMVKRLITEGFFEDERSGSVCRTPLQIASRSGDAEMVHLLLENGADLNTPVSDLNLTALQAAVLSGNFQLVFDMIQAGADINATSYGGCRTALQEAASYRRADIIQLLINNNHDLPSLRIDCKIASRIAHVSNHSAIAAFLESHAVELSERLGVEHGDDVDDKCLCEIYGRYMWCDWCGGNNLEIHRG